MLSFPSSRGHLQTSSGRSRRPAFVRLLLAACLSFICIFTLVHTFRSASASPSAILTSVAGTSHSKSKNAFVLFLADYSAGTDKPDEEDHYYIGTRVLVHQLLHNSETRTNTSIPVVILATEDVAPHRIQRLLKDGADVRIVDKIAPPEWAGDSTGQARWADAYAKLRTLQLVEFEQALFMDSDMMIVKRLDGIFNDPATDILPSNQTAAVEDEGPLPSKYMLAAQRAFERRQHSYPPELEDTTDLSSGFYVCHPSLEVFEYYIRLLSIPERVRTNSQDQDLMHYAHRREGPMPWKDIHFTWTTTWPSMKEYKLGAHTLHEKWWGERIGDLKDLDPVLQEMWMRQKFQMEVWTAMSDSQG